MKISYNLLWDKLKENNISKKQFRDASGIGSSTYTKLVNNENVTTDTLIKICETLDCQISEIIECVEE